MSEPLLGGALHAELSKVTACNIVNCKLLMHSGGTTSSDATCLVRPRLLSTATKGGTTK